MHVASSALSSKQARSPYSPDLLKHLKSQGYHGLEASVSGKSQEAPGFQLSLHSSPNQHRCIVNHPEHSTFALALISKSCSRLGLFCAQTLEAAQPNVANMLRRAPSRACSWWLAHTRSHPPPTFWFAVRHPALTSAIPFPGHGMITRGDGTA